MHALNAVRRGADDVRAGRDRASQRDHTHLGVGNQRVADRLAAAEEDVEHAGRQYVLGQFAEAQGGQWGQLGRFDYHGIASGQGRGDLPRQHHQRIIPGGDRGHYAQRVAADHRSVPGQVFTGRRATEAAGGAGKIAEHIGDGRYLVVQGRSEGFATILRLQSGQFIGMRFNRVGQCQQGQRALFGAGLRPAVEGMVGATHCRINLGIGGFVDLRQGTAFSGIEHGPGRAIACDQATVDQHVGLHRGLLVGHLPLPATLSPPRVR
ncbi:hypothetical protein D3C81_1439760 [compost metagenome]